MASDSNCRNDSCRQPLQAGWIFCPACGTSVNWLDVPHTHTVVFAPQVDAEYRVPLEGHGRKSMRARVEWREKPSALSALPPLVERSFTMIRFRLGKHMAVDTAQEAYTDIHTEDALRPHRWRVTARRTRTCRLRLVPETPGLLEVNEEIVFFDWKSPEARIHMQNAGGRPVGLRFVDIPPGVSVVSGPGMRLDEITSRHWRLAPGAEDTWTLRIERPREVVGRRAHLRIVPDDGPSAEIALFLPPPRHGGFRPRFVIGVDIGTENTSVCCRDLHQDGPGSVTPIRFSDQTTRMPTYVAFANEKATEPVAFGKAAVDRMTLGEGVVVRDLKIWFKHGREPFAGRYGPAFAITSLFSHFLGHLKREIDRYLAHQCDAQVNVRYCFTLPVLDEAEEYQKLCHKFRNLVLEVYRHDMEEGRLAPGDFEFLTEAEAAGLYFFQQFWGAHPKLVAEGFRDQDVICTLDAGAGTTDIVLMRMRIDEGEQSFDVLGEVGTDLPDLEKRLQEGATSLGSPPDSDDFGGRYADYRLLYALARGSLKAGKATPENIAAQYAMILSESDARKNYQAIGGAQAAKHALCSSDDARATIDFTEFYPDLDRSIPPVISRDVFHREIEPALQQILDRIDDLLARYGLARSQIRFVFAIGGSSNIPLVEQRLAQMFPGRLVSLRDHADIRKEAVASGAVWSYGARLGNLTPVDVSIDLTHAGETQSQAFLFKDRPISARPRRLDFYQVADLDVRLVAHVGDRAYRMTGLRIGARDDPQTVEISVHTLPDFAVEIAAQAGPDLHVAPKAFLK